MLRTIASKSNLVKKSETVVKILRGTFRRGLSVECGKKLHNTCLSRISHPLVQKQLQWHYQIRHYAGDLPHHVRVTLPALSPTMENGTIISWSKKEGDKLNEGDLLAEIETDKATMGFETPEEGYLAKIVIPAGTKGVPIGKLVCIIVESEADIAAFKDFKDDAAAAPAPPAKAPSPPPAAAPAPAAPSAPAAAPAGTGRVYVSPMAKRLAEQQNLRLQGKVRPEPTAGGRVYASPLARRLAEQQNIQLQGSGTGLYGSITSEDLSKLGPATATPSVPLPGQSFIDIPLTNMRQVIAKRLLESKTTIPHYYITQDVNVDRILAFRQRINKTLEKSKVKLTINDFIVKAGALACLKVPEVNSSWNGTFIRQFSNVDVSVAVATDKGLLTPIVFGANHKSVAQIHQEVKVLAQKARDGKLQPQEFQGGTFTVSNLGMFGVSDFCGIINPPQSCILAIGGTAKRLEPDEKSAKGFKVTQVMKVTLSCDHRIVDGAVGARWMIAFRELMEDPAAMVV